MDKKFLNVIEKVLNSDLLDKDLIDVPGPSTNLQIQKEENKLSKNISLEYKFFLKKYNGLNLDIIRFYGVGEADAHIRNLSDTQVDLGLDGVIIGDDSAGFYYIQNCSGQIYSCDSKSSIIKCLANSFSSFILDVVFGENADEFAGAEWKLQLREFGII